MTEIFITTKENNRFSVRIVVGHHTKLDIKNWTAQFVLFLLDLMTKTTAKFLPLKPNK